MPIYLVRARRETKSSEVAEFTVDSSDRDGALREVYRQLDEGEGNWEPFGEPKTERGYVPKGEVEILANGDEEIDDQRR